MAGAYTTYQPGDWFECKNQEMRQLVETGMVDTTPDILRSEYRVSDAGVLLRGMAPEPAGLDKYGLECKRMKGALSLPWERTVILGKGKSITAPSIVIGLSRIEAAADVDYEMAVMLASQTRLARDVGTEADQRRTLEVLGDLRLPVYDTSVLWVRRTEATEGWLAAWAKELADGSGEQHAFLRTLYTRRILVCTLPARWVARWYGV